jgi:hypothetical protein
VGKAMKRQISRRWTAVPRGKRYQIGVLVSPKVRKALTKSAAANGHTLTSEAERMIEKAFWYDGILADEKLKFAAIETGLFRYGYIPLELIDANGKTWAAWARPDFAALAIGPALPARAVSP